MNREISTLRDKNHPIAAPSSALDLASLLKLIGNIIDNKLEKYLTKQSEREPAAGFSGALPQRTQKAEQSRLKKQK